MPSPLGTIGLISAEPWDDVWRRNQHLASQIIRLGFAERLIFVGPALKLRHRAPFEPEPGIRVLTPHLVLPRHSGGIGLLVRELRGLLRGAGVLWINDALVGVRCLDRGVPAMYDVTDDWRAAPMTANDRARLVSAEDELARSVRTTVCSEVLRDRWFARYAVVPEVVHNGVDVDAHAAAEPAELDGPKPHVVYVGTLHQERLDLDLLIETVRSGAAGTVHLVGPDHLSDQARRRLMDTRGIAFHGAVLHTDVPQWMAAADVLVCPHRVDEFTLSLDAIKSFEYIASGRPVVATPTSGFQSFARYEGVHVIEPTRYIDALYALGRQRLPTIARRGCEHDWSIRAREFATQLSLAESPLA